MRASFLFFSILVSTSMGFASVEAMFHPYDPTLQRIANAIVNAEESVDIAVYNIDASNRNPIIAAIDSDEIQARLQSGDLKIRMIFEGYESKEGNQKKMAKLEDCGIDVRHLGSSRKMHHKYAVIDGNGQNPVLITGSANWSVSSRDHYNENILFFENKLGITKAFQREFHLLWNVSREFGETRFPSHEVNGVDANMEEGLRTYFNTENFQVKNGRLHKKRGGEGWVLTRQIVAAIDSADHKVSIATTRLRLRPIYEAILRAAERGVDVDIVVTMGEYEFKGRRNKMKLKDCDDVYRKDCSTSQNFVVYLERDNFPGHESVQVRYKWFHVKKSVYLQKQMHSKYIIVDDNRVLTGSFNWSVSSEYNHIENVVDFEGAVYPQLLAQFLGDFENLWNKNRDSFGGLIERYEDKLSNGEKIDCGFPAKTLSSSEIDYLLNTGRRVGESLTKACS